jgi:glycerophosphoryl diester phosphodiesterase
VAAHTLRLAHRGDWRHAPENSLAAFAAALAVPACDGLEFDVRRSADGVLVICHDETLRRTHGRPDRVDALSADMCETLGVPSLADVLRLAGRRPFLDVELKGDPGPTIIEVLAAGRGPDLSNAVVSSFDAVPLERIARLAPS